MPLRWLWRWAMPDPEGEADAREMAIAYYRWQPPQPRDAAPRPDTAEARSLEAAYRRERAELEANAGRVWKDYFAATTRAAVVGAGSDVLYIGKGSTPPGCSGVEEAIYEAERVKQLILGIPKARARRRLLGRLADSVVALMGLWREAAEGSPVDGERLRTYRRDLEAVRVAATESRDLWVRSSYTTWALYATILVSLAGAAIGPRIPARHLPLALAVLCGALGAGFTVMVRLQRGRTPVRRQFLEDANLTRLQGALRPVMGALAAGIAFYLVEGQLVPIAAPAGVSPTSFHAGLGFISGFTEWFVPDLLVRGARARTPEDEAQDAPAATQDPATQPAQTMS